MNVVDRFLNYVKIDTQSSATSSSAPSTLKQLDLARFLEKEMQDMGIQEVKLDHSGVVYGCLPSNTD